MSISDTRYAEAEADAVFSFERMQLSEASLHAIRMNLYHSSGPGFHIFRQFISPALVSHIRSVWPKDEMPPGYELLPPHSNYYVGGPNYYARYPDGTLTFYNFFHAAPLDEATHDVSGFVHLLRSRLSGRSAFDGLTGPRSVSYRVTLNRNFEQWIAPHRDFMDWERRWEKGGFDPSRLQATLFLSDRDVDYTGNGFLFEKNDGQQITLGGDVPIRSGDLLIWRFGNLHSVENVKCSPEQFGFMRILYPVHDMVERPPAPLSESRVLTRVRSVGAQARGVLGGIKRRLT